MFLTVVCIRVYKEEDEVLAVVLHLLLCIPWYCINRVISYNTWY